MGLALDPPLPALRENELESVKTVAAFCIFALLVAAFGPRPCAAATEGAGFSAEGLLLPSAQARLASRSKGVIDQIKREGDRVAKGEAVMQLESDMELLQRDQQKHILDLRAFQRSASDELSEKSVISKTEVEEKRVNHEVARVQLQQAEKLLDMRKVSAPFDGVVSERLRERGEAVDEFTPVVTLVNLDELYLEVFLPASRIRQVRSGEKVRVTVPDLPGSGFDGSVAEVAPAVNPASGEFKVRIRLPNPAHHLAAGTSAVAHFSTVP